MSATPRPTAAPAPASASPPRFGGILWWITRHTTAWAMPLAGKRWNPIFAVVVHRGRRTGSRYATPVAARREDGGFIISLAFGARADWYRNLVAAGGGTLRWRGGEYEVGAPEVIDRVDALPAFHPIQRLLLRIGAIDGFIRVRDVAPVSR